MHEPFHFLSSAEFERLSFQERLAYLGDAMAELKRGKRGRQDYSWDDLFKQTPTQEEQSKT